MGHPVILFDGVCNLCNRSVQFFIRRDRDALFRFASLQSDFGQSFLQKHGLAREHFSSFILVEDGIYHTKSTAVLKALEYLPGWSWMRVFFIVPVFLRDGLYQVIARNRYRWFGKKEHCWVPTTELASRFIDQVS